MPATAAIRPSSSSSRAVRPSRSNNGYRSSYTTTNGKERQGTPYAKIHDGAGSSSAKLDGADDGRILDSDGSPGEIHGGGDGGGAGRCCSFQGGGNPFYFSGEQVSTLLLLICLLLFFIAHFDALLEHAFTHS